MLTVRCFGSFQVTHAGRALEFPTRRSRALLAYLAASGDHWQTRESLAALLWPESGAEAARRSLRQELSTVRALVGDAALEVEADRVRLAPGQYSCDLERVESARPTGDFLEDMSALADPFDDWLTARRREYREAALATLESLLTRAEQDDRPANAIRLAQQMLAIEPSNEAVHRTLMRAYVTTNQPALALQQFRRCLTVLRRELQVAPSAETRALYDRVRAAQRTSLVRVLVVDDNPVTRTQIEALLADRFDVRLAEHGAHALLDVGADETDLVIADVDMPVLGGLTLLEVLRERAAQLPVLIITGMEGKDVERRARALGASGFLRRPIDARLLLAAIRRVLAARRGSQPPV